MNLLKYRICKILTRKYLDKTRHALREIYNVLFLAITHLKNAGAHYLSVSHDNGDAATYTCLNCDFFTILEFFY